MRPPAERTFQKMVAAPPARERPNVPRPAARKQIMRRARTIVWGLARMVELRSRRDGSLPAHRAPSRPCRARLYRWSVFWTIAAAIVGQLSSLASLPLSRDSAIFNAAPSQRRPLLALPASASCWRPPRNHWGSRASFACQEALRSLSAAGPPGPARANHHCDAPRCPLPHAAAYATGARCHAASGPTYLPAR